MPAWCKSSNCQAAKDEIKQEIKTRGWDKLGNTSSFEQRATGEAQRRHVTIHLEGQYPTARKSPAAWIKFIKKITGEVKKWTSASTAYTQGVNQTHNTTKSDTRLKFKAGKGLTPDARKDQDLDLTPAEEKLLAP